MAFCPKWHYEAFKPELEGVSEWLAWASLGSGFIAESYADALHDVRNAELVACYSRNSKRSAAFAEKWKIAAHATMDRGLAPTQPSRS